eukprot:g7759.t1
MPVRKGKKKKQDAAITRLTYGAGIIAALFVVGMFFDASPEEASVSRSAPSTSAPSSAAPDKHEINLDSMQPTDREKFAGLAKRGIAANLEKDHATAMEHFEAAVAISDNVPEVNHMLAMLYMQKAKNDGKDDGYVRTDVMRAHALNKKAYGLIERSHAQWEQIAMPYLQTMAMLEPGEKHANVYAELDKCTDVEACNRLRKAIDSQEAEASKVAKEQADAARDAARSEAENMVKGAQDKIDENIDLDSPEKQLKGEELDEL